MSHGRVALKHGLDAVDFRSRDATLKIDALYSVPLRASQRDLILRLYLSLTEIMFLEDLSKFQQVAGDQMRRPCCRLKFVARADAG